MTCTQNVVQETKGLTASALTNPKPNQRFNYVCPNESKT